MSACVLFEEACVQDGGKGFLKGKEFAYVKVFNESVMTISSKKVVGLQHRNCLKLLPLARIFHSKQPKVM